MANISNLNGEIAERVSAAIEAAGITQKELATQAGLADRTLARLLAGESDWRVVKVRRIAAVLDANYADLILGSAD